MAPLMQVRYDRLIARAVARGTPGGYYERHHIVPRGCGGDDNAGNLVCLTAQEHFIAHWLLYRIYRTPATARAFKLMVHDKNKRRGKDYALARESMSASMRGDGNVSRRPEVRAKLIEKAHSPFAGKKRPEHSALMKAKGLISGDKNPFYGMGERQLGVLNHMATKVNGIHVFYGVVQWVTATAAAKDLGVSIQAVAQAIKLKGRSKGWRLEYTT